jgi:hypothetical protein
VAAWGCLEGLCIAAGATAFALVLFFPVVAVLALTALGEPISHLLSGRKRARIQPDPDWQLGKGLIAAPDPGPDQCPVCGMDDLSDRRKVGLTVPYGRFEAHESCKELVPVPVDMLAVATVKQATQPPAPAQSLMPTGERGHEYRTPRERREPLQPVAVMSRKAVPLGVNLNIHQTILYDAVMGASAADAKLFLAHFVDDLRSMTSVFPGAGAEYKNTMKEVFFLMQEELQCEAMAAAMSPVGDITSEVKLFGVREVIAEFYPAPSESGRQIRRGW